MLAFKKGIHLQNPKLSRKIISYYNGNNENDSFFDDMISFVERETNINNLELPKDNISAVEKTLSDLKVDNLEITDVAGYKKLRSVISQLAYKLQNIKLVQENQTGYTEIPLSAYNYIGNNKTKFKKNEKLSSLLYK